MAKNTLRGGNRFKLLSQGRRAARGEMNKTEQEYADLLTVDETVHAWWFEPMSLRLTAPEKGQPARYTPDFMVLLTDGTTFMDDVKGSGVDNEAAAVRAKCAAELYPLWIFRIAKKQKARDGGGWDVREV